MRGFYVGENGYNSLLVRLLLRQEPTPVFERVYPQGGEAMARVSVWAVDYPDDVVDRPECLRQAFAEGPLKQAWMFGSR